MGATTKIEWTDSTFNPWWGCERISPACDHCYAASWAKRSGEANLWEGERRRTSAENWKQPVKWNRQHDAFFAEHGRRRRVFCASMADVFDNAVDAKWRSDLFQLIEATPNLDWLLLTKRIGNVKHLCAGVSSWPNVWLGATVANQEEADRDIPKLLATPARVRFLSIEPMLEEIDLTPWLWGRSEPCADCPEDIDCECGAHTRKDLKLPAIDWVIVGGESGAGARPMHQAWPRSIREQCAGAGVPFLFKQWGEWLPGEVYSRGTAGGFARHQDGTDGVHGGKPDHWWSGDAFGGVISTRVGKTVAGRMLDGRTHDGFPGDPR